MINKTKQNNITGSRKQMGVGLIDVLIAVVVFSIGMLGLAALQTITKQSNYEAIQRGTAAMLAQDMMERMRMNSQSVYVGGTTISSLSYYVASATVTLTPSAGNTSTSPSPDCTDNNTSTTCDFTELANWDKYVFRQMLFGINEISNGNEVGGLLNPTACISTGSLTVGGPGPYTVTIVWRGQTKLDNQSANTCGNNLDLYDTDVTDPDYIRNDFVYRRILEMKSFMSCPDPGGCS